MQIESLLHVKRRGARWRAVASIVALAAMPPRPAAAQAPTEPGRAVYAQVGTSEYGRQLALGAHLPWPAAWRFDHPDLAVHWDASVSRWRFPSARTERDEWLTQLGLTPTVRWWPWRRGFVQIGVGLTVTDKRYETDAKRFSSRFNFGSHLGGAGRSTRRASTSCCCASSITPTAVSAGRIRARTSCSCAMRAASRRGRS